MQEHQMKNSEQSPKNESPNYAYSTRKRASSILINSFGLDKNKFLEQLQIIDQQKQKNNQPGKLTLKQLQEREKMQKKLENQEKLFADQALEEINNKYQLLGKIGQGGFGFVYKAIKVCNGDQVAIKFEKKTGNQFQEKLQIEANIIYSLNNKDNRNPGFPMVYEYYNAKEFSYMVTNLLDFNLDQLLSVQPTRCFSLKTVCMIGYEIVQRLQLLHQKNYIYRDIKPENIMIGDCRLLYLIDFGLSKSYKNLNGEHIEEKQRGGLVGTPRYASINSHLGKELSRRDDFESLGYMLIYLLNGDLPWIKICSTDPDKIKQNILELKQKTTIDQLCTNSPKEFKKYFKYVRSLSFIQQPNYNYLGQIFTTVLKKEQQSFDYKFDWVSWIQSKKGLKFLISLNSVRLPSETLRTPSRPMTLQSLSEDYFTQKMRTGSKKTGSKKTGSKKTGSKKTGSKKRESKQAGSKRMGTSFKQLKNDLNQLTRKNTLKKLSISRIPYCTEEQDELDQAIKNEDLENLEDEDSLSLSPVIFPSPKLIKQIQYSFSQMITHIIKEQKSEIQDNNQIKELYRKTIQALFIFIIL